MQDYIMRRSSSKRAAAATIDLRRATPGLEGDAKTVQRTPEEPHTSLTMKTRLPSTWPLAHRFFAVADPGARRSKYLFLVSFPA